MFWKRSRQQRINGLTLTAYNDSCAKMRSEDRNAYIRTINWTRWISISLTTYYLKRLWWSEVNIFLFDCFYYLTSTYNLYKTGGLSLLLFGTTTISTALFKQIRISHTFKCCHSSLLIPYHHLSLISSSSFVSTLLTTFFFLPTTYQQ